MINVAAHIKEEKNKELAGTVVVFVVLLCLPFTNHSICSLTFVSTFYQTVFVVGNDLLSFEIKGCGLASYYVIRRPSVA